jgi:cysteine synthase A
MRLAQDVLKLIGSTPMIRLDGISKVPTILAKLEFLNPTGSIKDRMVWHIIRAAEKTGAIKPGSTIVEATSGNTGVSLAMIAAVRGYEAVLVMPTGTAPHKVKMMRAFGAQIVHIPTSQGMGAVVAKAKELAEGAFLLNQFENPHNILAHRETGKEILAQTGGQVDAFVAGVGTGGTLIGVAQVLKKETPDVQIIAVEPRGAPALFCKFYGKPMPPIRGIPHQIEGIGEGFVSRILADNLSLIDRVMLVGDGEAAQMARRLAREGLLVGISSGANVCASLRVGKELGSDSTIVTVLPDGGQRYLDAKLFG